jgi:hypothetical protein
VVCASRSLPPCLTQVRFELASSIYRSFPFAAETFSETISHDPTVKASFAIVP